LFKIKKTSATTCQKSLIFEHCQEPKVLEAPKYVV